MRDYKNKRLRTKPAEDHTLLSWLTCSTGVWTFNFTWVFPGWKTTLRASPSSRRGPGTTGFRAIPPAVGLLPPLTQALGTPPQGLSTDPQLQPLRFHHACPQLHTAAPLFSVAFLKTDLMAMAVAGMRPGQRHWWANCSICSPPNTLIWACCSTGHAALPPKSLRSRAPVPPQGRPGALSPPERFWSWLFTSPTAALPCSVFMQDMGEVLEMHSFTQEAPSTTTRSACSLSPHQLKRRLPLHLYRRLRQSVSHPAPCLHIF